MPPVGFEPKISAGERQGRSPAEIVASIYQFTNVSEKRNASIFREKLMKSNQTKEPG